jgi:glutathione synthase/RimK-type ligase-like ATP-grasp enzyme
VETLGIMTLKDTSEQEYFTEIALKAADNGITCLRFIPLNINPTSKMVTGSIFDLTTRQWKQEIFPIPNVLYDRCFYGEDVQSKQCISIVSWLKECNDLFFLGYGLPNKYELYNVLKRSSLRPYLPSTTLINDSNMVLEELSLHQRIVLKPINGSQGNGIFYLELKGTSICVKTFNRNQHIHKIFSNHKRFLTWLDLLLTKKSYLFQPYLELLNHQNEPFDIRILLQKDGDGNWVERGRGIRTGHPDGILSNLSAGGRISSFQKWKEHLSPNLEEFLEAEINDILSKIPILLEEAFLPLFELGIDIGVTRNGSIWILDINSKPGRKVILATNPEMKEELYKAPILYCKTLTSSVKNERKRYHAKTLSY